MKPFTLLLVDDHPLFRSGLSKLIEGNKDYQVVAEAGSAEETLKLLEDLSVDLIIVDIALPGKNGLVLTDEIRSLYPRQKILILSSYKHPEYVRHVMSHGASGYIPKEDVFERFIKAMEEIKKGGTYISPSIQQVIMKSFLSDKIDTNIPYPEVLTKTERKVIALISGGKSNKEVAHILKVSTRTIETHRAHILKKINGKNTASLVQYAISTGLVTVTPGNY